MNINRNTILNTVLLAIVIILIGISCTNTTKKVQTPKEKIETILTLAEKNIKETGTSKMYRSISDEDPSNKKVLQDAAKAKYNSRMKFTMTELCLKERRGNLTTDDNIQNQYVNDSIYLTAIKTKSKEIEDQSFKDNDKLTLLNIIIGIEKINLLINEMNKICPTDGNGKLIK